MISATISYDCQTCGACCQSPWTGDGYVTLYEIDLVRLAGSGLPIIEQDQSYGDSPDVILKLSTRIDDRGRRMCMAFSGTIGESSACAIYDHRPEACRHFEIGGSLCRDKRRQLGLPV